jgi:predicted DNA-binding transcriptional regulator AlpA
MAEIGIWEIGKRLGVSRATAWRWAHRGRFGEPVDRTTTMWRFVDDEVLALTLSILRKSGSSRAWVWKTAGRNFHVQRLNQICRAEVEADEDDREMAATLLAVAARHHERRAKGLENPATVSAWVACSAALARSRAGDPNIRRMLLGVACQLSPEKTEENDQPEI